MSTNIAYEIWVEDKEVNMKILSQTDKFLNQSSTYGLKRIVSNYAVVLSKGEPSLRIDANGILFISLWGSIKSKRDKVMRLGAKDMCDVNEIVSRIHAALAEWSAWVDTYSDCVLDETKLGETVV